MSDHLLGWREIDRQLFAILPRVRSSGRHARCDLDAPLGDTPNHTQFVYFVPNEPERGMEWLIMAVTLVDRPVKVYNELKTFARWTVFAVQTEGEGQPSVNLRLEPQQWPVYGPHNRETLVRFQGDFPAPVAKVFVVPGYEDVSPGNRLRLWPNALPPSLDVPWSTRTVGQYKEFCAWCLS